MRHTSSHTKNRRSHHALKNVRLVVNKENGNLTLPHHIDEATGMYNGKQIYTPKVKAVKVAPKVKGPRTEPKHDHDHPEKEGSKGILGRITGGAKPKSRSGMGGGV